MNHNTKRRVAGFTMIELMIAMAVTMVLLYAAMRAFRDASQSSRQISLASDMTDNLRAGLNYIHRTWFKQVQGFQPRHTHPEYQQWYGHLQRGCGSESAFLKRRYHFSACNSVLPSIEPGQAMGPLITSPDATAGNPSNPASFTDEITMLYADNSSGLDGSPVNQPPPARIPAVPNAPSL